jgi:hypothetical protein
MSYASDNHDPHDASRGPALTDLPPVEAPSAGFIVQLFVIPALIVGVVIVVWLLFGKLAGGERDAMEYVRQLRSPSAHWRAAFELASLIQNDPKLASDPVLLGELTDLLGHDLDKDESPELTQYVALTLGAFQTLEARSRDGRKIDPLAALSRALAPKHPAAVRRAAAISLAKQAGRLDGKLDDVDTVRALGAASEDAEPELRQVAVYALGFFGGDMAAQILRDRLKDVDCYVRYNAANALGRRGDAQAQAVFREMLSTADLNKVVSLSSEVEKRSKVESIELSALQALQTSVDHRRTELASALRPEIDNLAKSGLVSVRNKAQELAQDRRLDRPHSPSNE